MKINLFDDRDDLVIKLNSMAVALMLTASAISCALVRISFLSQLPNNLFVLAVVVMLIFFQFILTKKLYIPTPAIVVTLFVTLWYVLTLFFNSARCDLNLIQFIFYAIIPVFVIGQRLDSELVLRYSLYLSLITLPVINDFFEIQYEQYSQAYMGNIYPILPPVIIAMIHFKLYRKESNILTKIAYLYNLFVLIKMLLYANRGAVMCIVFCSAVLLINSYENEERKKLGAIKTLLILAGIALAFAAILNLSALLEGLAHIFQSAIHSVPSVISKMLQYVSIGDISDGRNIIDDFTIPEIWNRPVFGHGIKTFQAYAFEITGREWPYPHQYIYQYLFEGGIVFGLLPIYLSLSLAVKVICTRIKSKKEFALCCTLVCLCIPKLLVSTDPWASTSIWMLVTYSFIYITKTNRLFTEREKRLSREHFRGLSEERQWLTK